MIFNMTGGGTPLNFKVVGNPQPTNPTENTIWVNTDVTVTDWCFAANEPQSPQNGNVWLIVGTSSALEFNALKKHAIQVYPFSGKIYTNGSWKNVPVYTYRNGSWSEWWDGTLFNSGNEYEMYTGGFVSVGTCTFKKENGFLMLRDNTYGGVYTDKKINITPFKTVECILTPLESNENRMLIVTTNKITDAETQTPIARNWGGSQANEEATLSIDISSINGEYYIGVGRFGSSNQGGCNTNISIIRLVR